MIPLPIRVSGPWTSLNLVAVGVFDVGVNGFCKDRADLEKYLAVVTVFTIPRRSGACNIDACNIDACNIVCVWGGWSGKVIEW